MRLLELFCGTGGFSQGARRAGLHTSLAIDIDPVLTSSYKTNFPRTRLVLEDVAKLDAKTLLQLDKDGWDGVVGGPPCQGFSDIGRKDPMDGRRRLLSHFFRVVDDLKPAFFVFENVTGLLREGRRQELDDGLKIVDKSYDVMKPTVWNAADFGAATNRKRLFVIGFRKSLSVNISPKDILEYRKPFTPVRECIGDLKSAVFSHEDESGFDHWKLALDADASSYASEMRRKDGLFTGNRSTLHTSEVVGRFSKVQQGETDKVGRHHRLAWDGLCPTLRAGTGSDRGSYQSVRPIHPELNRVITVREAARLQGFPDSHVFHPTVWHSFRMIGNSVSPLMAEAIFRLILSKIPATRLNILPRQN